MFLVKMNRSSNAMAERRRVRHRASNRPQVFENESEMSGGSKLPSKYLNKDAGLQWNRVNCMKDQNNLNVEQDCDYKKICAKKKLTG